MFLTSLLYEFSFAQAETDDLYKKISEYESNAKEANSISDKYDMDIRDMSKKVQKLEVSNNYLQIF